VAVRHWDDEALKRLGEVLVVRRVELDPRYHSRKLFAEETGINLRRLADLENGRRGGAPPLALQNVFAPAYRVEYQSVVDVLAGDGDLEALPGTPPHKSPRRRKAAVSPLTAAAPSGETEIPGVLNMLAVPGIGPYLAEVDAERDTERDGGGQAARNQDELRIFADARFTETAKRALVAYRRMVLDEAARSQGENAG